MCVVAPTPLPIDTRVAIVELCCSHELLVGTCSVSVPARPRGIVETIKRLFGPLDRFEGIETADAGPWIAERVRSLAESSEVRVTCNVPNWKGEPVAGGFCYRAAHKPFRVKTVNLYRAPGERSPHEPPDGVIGAFHDVLALEAKRDLDGRIAASSAFVRALKKLTGTKVICRASWV